MDRKDKTRIIIIFAFIIVILVSFALRSAGITFGFPLFTHPDEPAIVNRARNIISHRDLNPRFFNYPSLYIYLQTILYCLIYFSGKLFHLYKNFSDIDLMTLYFWGRLLTVILSTLTLCTIYFVGNLIFNQTTGFLSVLFASFSMLHVAHSYLITVDTPMTLWVALAFLMSTLIYTQNSKTWHYVANGIFIGLAIGTKYTAVWIIVPMLTAHVLNCLSTGKKFIDRQILLGLATIPAVFFITTPYSILTTRQFLRAIYFESVHYRTGHPGYESQTTAYRFYSLVLFKEYGAIPLLLSIIGILLLGSDDKRKLLLIGSFPLVYFTFVGSYRVHFDRNAVVLILFLALLSGYAVSGLFRLLWANQNLAFKGATTLLLILLVSIGLYKQIETTMIHINTIRLTDTRLLAKHWIENHISTCASIGKEHYTPPLAAIFNRVDDLGYYGLIKSSLGRYDYLIASSCDYSRFVINDITILNHVEKYGPYYYFVTGGQCDHSKFLSNAVSYSDEASRYRELFASNELVKEFVPDYATSTGPIIRIYKTARDHPKCVETGFAKTVK